MLLPGHPFMARQEAFRSNPRVISPESVEAVVNDLGDEPLNYSMVLEAKRLKGTDFTEILHPEFQLFRIGVLGFEVPVKSEDKEKYGIKVDSLESMGREDVKLSEDEDIGWDCICSINTMRAFVICAFAEEAKRQGLRVPKINDKLIDPGPAKKGQIETAWATGPGLFIYSWEELEQRWSLENPPLYNATVSLKDRLGDLYGERMIAAYKDLPQEYLDKIGPEVKETYRDQLMEYALRTYAMLAPEPPLLIEVTDVRPAK